MFLVQHSQGTRCLMLVMSSVRYFFFVCFVSRTVLNGGRIRAARSQAKRRRGVVLGG